MLVGLRARALQTSGRRAINEVFAAIHQTRSCLKLAIEHELKTIAFPAISTGVYGYPLDDAADVSLRAVLVGAAGGSLSEVHFVLFGADTFSTYVSTATKLFGEPLLDDDVSSEGSGFECRTSRAFRPKRQEL
ncbi:A1pp-domain-containing protein [Haematococcus lacustris]|uniref:A1pp-domain-containing protein n=1 Tax=Haematococcus lacustris TaxID=44745 RepID=A0A699YF04_HAELA|nr:A1pp-domain-containing protein [Haematococcus lacustris]